MINDEFPMSVHAFMRSNAPLDDAGKARLQALVTYERKDVAVKGNEASFCLDSACTHAQADKLATLVDDYGADVNSYNDLMSDSHPGKTVRRNLLDNAIESFNLCPDSDRTAAGKKRLAQTVEFLLQRGVPAAPNPDPREGAVAYAYALAYPDFQSKGFDAGIWAAFGRAADPAAAGDQGFREPYELIRQYQPEAVARLEKALHVKTQPGGPAAEKTGSAFLSGWKKMLDSVRPGRQ